MGRQAAASSSAAGNQWANLSFDEVLEDLSSRFVVNLPSEELQRIERICFQVEQAHWFYEDFLRPLNSSLPSLGLRKFSIYILQTASLSVPLIRQYISSGSQSGENGSATVQLDNQGGATYGLEAAFDEFLKYKTRVPVCGAVLLADDWKSCLLVKGWKSSASWGFPKGKINQSESPRDCAVRETYEETGFDCSELLAPDSPNWMELNVREQSIRLYIVPNVPKETGFVTQTRKEISKIEWFKLADLPTWKQSHAGGQGGLISANAGSKFYLVTPFIGKLKNWIKENKKKYVSANATAAVSSLPTEPAAQRRGGNDSDVPSAPAAMRASTTSAQQTPSFVDAFSAWPLDGSVSTAQPTHQGAVRNQQEGQPEANDSAALLAMLKGSLSLEDSTEPSAPLAADTGSSSSPLPAPRPQKTAAHTLKLLEKLSPNGASQTSHPEVGAGLSPAERERERKRALLLQQLTGPTSTPSSASNSQLPPSSASNPQLPPSSASGGHGHNVSSEQGREANLLALLSSPAQQPSQQPRAPQESDTGRAALLNMLNAGPLQPSQQGHPQRTPAPHSAQPAFPQAQQQPGPFGPLSPLPAFSPAYQHHQHGQPFPPSLQPQHQFAGLPFAASGHPPSGPHLPSYAGPGHHGGQDSPSRSAPPAFGLMPSPHQQHLIHQQQMPQYQDQQFGALSPHAFLPAAPSISQHVSPTPAHQQSQTAGDKRHQSQDLLALLNGSA